MLPVNPFAVLKLSAVDGFTIDMMSFCVSVMKMGMILTIAIIKVFTFVATF